MAIQIRPFEDDDYDAVVAVLNSATPRNVMSVARLRDWDTNAPDYLKAARWVAETEGEVVAVGDYSQSSDMYHPHKFRIAVSVRPEHQRRGIGSDLYDFVTAQLDEHDPIAYQARAYADQDTTLRFLRRRGYEEDFRMWESVLDVDSFDFEPWREIEPHLQAQGIEIVPLTDLAGDPGRDRQVFDLEQETLRDVPSPESVTSHREQSSPDEVEEQFARYVERVINHPDRPPDAYFVARRDAEYIGLTYFELDREHRRAEIMMTGVKKAYRGTGVGTALKVRGVRWAREHGYGSIVTGNDTVNLPILAINERMGFVREPEMIFFEKPLSS